MRAFPVIALAASTLAAVPAPAAAGPHWRGGHHFHGGGWGGGWGGGPALAFGLAAGVLAAGAAAECVSYEPLYDDYGNIVGRRRVWEC